MLSTEEPFYTMSEYLPKRNVGLLQPKDESCVSWYRGLGPWKRLVATTDGRYSITVPKDMLWPTSYGLDCILASHYHGQQALGILATIKLLGIPVIGDLDDNFWDFPTYLESAATFKTDLPYQNDIVKSFDAVTTSTEELAGVITGQTGVKPIVIPNAIDLDAMNKLTRNYPQIKRDLPIIHWRSATWTAFRRHMPAIQEIVKNNKVLFILQGPTTGVPSKPEFDDLFKDSKYFYSTQWQPLMHYYATYWQYAPDIELVLHNDNQFDNCRSATAWLEATWAGAFTVAPNHTEWKRPACFNYDVSDPMSIVPAVEKAISRIPNKEKDEDLLYAKRMLKNEYNLDTVSLKRIRLVAEILNDTSVLKMLENKGK